MRRLCVGFELDYFQRHYSKYALCKLLGPGLLGATFEASGKLTSLWWYPIAAPMGRSYLGNTPRDCMTNLLTKF